MTREQAVSAIHAAHHPDDHDDMPGTMKWDVNRRWAEKAVNGYVALGILKLDEPENADERATRKAAVALDQRGWSRGFFSVLDDAGLKIVEKD